MSAHNHLQEALIAEFEMVPVGNGGAIIPDRSPAVQNLRTVAAETRTLPRPLNVGQELTIVLGVDGGDCVVTAAAAINAAGNTVMTFDNAGDMIRLVAVPIGANLFWRVVGNDGVALS
jgi:hypothetical protein